MIRNFNDLCKAMFARIDYYEENVSQDSSLWGEVANNDPATKFLRKLNATYIRAQVNAVKFGMVGVGCITFAEQRMQQYQERLARKLA